MHVVFPPENFFKQVNLCFLGEVLYNIEFDLGFKHGINFTSIT